MNERDFDDGLSQILVCTYGEDCANATKRNYGTATAIYDAIKSARNVRGFNRKLYVIRSSCQGWCEYAPVCTILPQGRVLRDVEPDRADILVEAVVAKNEAMVPGKLVWDFSKSREENLKNKKEGGK